jgi:hypothetical protein
MARHGFSKFEFIRRGPPDYEKHLVGLRLWLVSTGQQRKSIERLAVPPALARMPPLCAPISYNVSRV